MITRNYNEILERMKNHIIANQNTLTDFNKGGVLLTQLEAQARALERFYFDVRNGFASNLNALAYSIFDFKPKNGLKATAEVKFIRSRARTTKCTIQSGVKVSSNGLYFETTGTAVIPENETESNLVTVQAMDIGLKYNVAQNSIITIESVVPQEVVSVTNPQSASGGADNESDTDVLIRFKEFLNGLQGTNNYGIKSAVQGIDGVRSLYLKENFPPKEDYYNITLYIDDGAGGLSKDLKQRILDLVDGTDTEVNPGKRASGINVEVLPATVTPINVAVNVKVYRTEILQAKADITKSIKEYIDTLKVGESVIQTSLIMKLRRISYIKDITSLTLNESPANVVINYNSIAKIKDISIEVVNI